MRFAATPETALFPSITLHGLAAAAAVIVVVAVAVVVCAAAVSTVMSQVIRLARTRVVAALTGSDARRDGLSPPPPSPTTRAGETLKTTT